MKRLLLRESTDPTGMPWAEVVTRAEKRVSDAEDALRSAKDALIRAKSRAACPHARTDNFIFGDTCLDCGLYMNNGI